MRMLKPVLSCCLLAVIVASCTKEDAVTANKGFIKSIQSVPEVSAIKSIVLDDGNILIVTRDRNRMVKINERGEKIWDKPLLYLNDRIDDAISIPGSGYATLGCYKNNFYLNVILYDLDGNPLQHKWFTLTNKVNIWHPFKIHRLSNGHYVIASGKTYASDNSGLVMITDQQFNLLSSKTVWAPPKFTGFEIRGISETSDGNIAMIAATSYECTVCDTQITNIMLFRTDLNGNYKSLQPVIDYVHSEIPNDVSRYSGGVFSVSSRMTGWNDDQGVFTNYYGSLSISGKITLDFFDAGGQHTGSRELDNYPGNGVVNAITPTFDGGYILCGTVNTHNSAFVLSKTKIYVCKMSAGLDVQWSEVFDTNYPAIGVDVQQTSDGGYLILGRHNLLDIPDRILVIKTDASGKY